MKKRLIYIIVSVLFLLVLASCSKAEKQTAEAESEKTTEATTPVSDSTEATTEYKPDQKEHEGYNIAVILPKGDRLFVTESEQAARDEAEKLKKEYQDLNIIVKSFQDVNAQVVEIQRLLNEGTTDAVMLWPFEGATVRPIVQKATDAGIKVVVYNNYVDTVTGIDAQFQADNAAIGREMGEYISEFFADRDSVNYLRLITDSYTATVQRTSSLGETMDTSKFIQLNGTYVTGGSAEKAKQFMETFLQNSDETVESLDMVISFDDDSTQGIMDALEEYSGTANLNVRLIVSVGGQEEILQRFENTQLDVKLVTWNYSPDYIREPIDYIAGICEGKTYSGKAVHDGNDYVIPSFSIGNSGNADFDFESYRSSDEYKKRYAEK